MYTLIRSVATRDLITQQLPAFTFSFLVAERFYKFHSFMLECLAFLATWYVVDAVFTLSRFFLRRDRDRQ
jgi:hypothetical protein